MLDCCVLYQEGEQSPVQLGRQGETPQAMVVLLKGFMAGTKVARRVAPSVEGEKKNKRKRKETLVKRRVRVQHV